jgi:hypothetical protein
MQLDGGVRREVTGCWSEEQTACCRLPDVMERRGDSGLLVLGQRASLGQIFRWWGRPLDCGGYGRTAGVRPNEAPPPHGEMLVYGSLSSGRELQYVGR